MLRPAPRVRPWEQLSAAEWRRRLWHMGPGFLPFILWPIPHQDPLGPILRYSILAITAGLVIAVLRKYRTIERVDDDRIGVVFGYAAFVLLTILLFPAQLELGLTVLAVIAFGDGSATLGGMLLRGPTLPWNPRKTWAGFGCFILGAAPLSSLIYWGEAQPKVSASVAIACGVAATLVAAVAESLPLRINDNIRVGLAAAVGAITVHGWLVGF